VIDVSKLSGDTIKFGATALRSIRRSATSAHAARWTNARSAPAALKPTSARKSMRNTAPTAWRRWRSKPLPLTPDSASYAASTSPIADQSTMRRCHSIGRATTTTGHCYRSHSSSGASPLNRPKSVPQDRLTHSCGSTCRHRRPRSWGGFSRSHCTAHDPSADRGSAETRPRVETKLVWYSSLSREGTALRIVHSKDHE
jgi:hypothetical protein